MLDLQQVPSNDDLTAEALTSGIVRDAHGYRKFLYTFTSVSTPEIWKQRRWRSCTMTPSCAAAGASGEATVSKIRTGSFNVVDDTGREDTVHVYTLYEEMIDLDGPSGRTEVGKEYTAETTGTTSASALTGSSWRSSRAGNCAASDCA